MKNTLLSQDKIRYGSSRPPVFQVMFRKYQQSSSKTAKLFFKALYRLSANKNHVEIPTDTKIGGGLYLGHAFCITINPSAVIGSNCNIHKGVTIGQENRGSRMGAPVIGDSVWIGVNATIVGNITVGSDVLIAPNTYVNCNIPPNSVVYGNPCIIKQRENATEHYINRKCEL